MRGIEKNLAYDDLSGTPTIQGFQSSIRVQLRDNSPEDEAQTFSRR